MHEFGLRSNKYDIFPLVFPRCDIEISDFSSILLVKAGVRYTHYMLQCLVVSKETTPFGGDKVFAAGISGAAYRKMARCQFREGRGRLPEKHTTLRAVIPGSVERGDSRCRVSRDGGHIRGKTDGGLFLCEGLSRFVSSLAGCPSSGLDVRRIRLDWSMQLFSS